jgi:molecular chaperone GrpE
MTEEIRNKESVSESDFAADSRSAEQGSEESPIEVEELARERDELKDLLLRKQAEFENFRKRTERERADFAQHATSDIMRDLLSVLDSFELALKAARSGAGGYQGFELIQKQLIDTLSRAGLEAIEAEGQPFDPHIHEAVSTQPAPHGVADGTVLTELRRGYQLRGKLLRPTMVTVAASTSGGGQ